MELRHQHGYHLARPLTQATLERRAYLGAAAIVLALTAYRFWASAHIGLAADEAYYWLWSRRLSGGYLDHPPMVAWWIWASTAVFGDTEFGVRALSVISAALTSVAIFATARNLGPTTGLAARGAVWFNATILIGVGAILITPDSPSVLFWALTVWVLADIRRTGDGWMWLLAGAFAGLGCLSKYTNLFLGAGILLWLVLDRDARRWFLSPWLWAGGVVAVLVFLPALLWNADHGWISFAKQFGRISEGGIKPAYVAEYIASQFGLLNPIIAVFVGLGAWLAVRGFGRRERTEERALIFLLVLCLPLVLYMLVHSLHARVQGNWLAPVYAGLILLAVIAAAGAASRFMTGLAGLAAPVGIAISVLALGYFAAPLPTPFGLTTPAERMVGWQGLAERIEGLRSDTGAGWIATADYGLTGELAFYGPGAALVQQVDERQRYLFDQVDPSVTTASAILVLPEERSDLTKFQRCFDSLEPLGSVQRDGPDGPVATYLVWLADGARRDILRRGCR
ncbi:MAG: glycosyltransferase family 39 protein [Bauldia sp.]|nr:glycosyltransferase family 39 protein [Bauldia sp.]